MNNLWLLAIPAAPVLLFLTILYSSRRPGLTGFAPNGSGKTGL
jgi:hypothetical protein